MSEAPGTAASSQVRLVVHLDPAIISTTCRPASLEVFLAPLLWTQEQDFGPSPRSGHALAFDSNLSRVLLFGGLAATASNPPTASVGDTWEWNGENWTQVADIGPSPRSSFAMAYDSNRNRLVLFGGLTSNGASGETWEWDGQDWTQVSETGPQARILHAMAFDSTNNAVVLYGGQLQQGDPTQETSYLNDTWQWDGQAWTQQDDSGPNRCGHAMTYDDSRQRLVLFGGSDAKNQRYGDTWEWDGTTWTQRTDFGPPACTGASLVFTGAECVLFGGAGSSGLQKQTWTWDGTYWTARQDMGPSARTGQAAAFDSVRQRVVLFGGQDQTQSPLGDTWEQNADIYLSGFTVSKLNGTGTMISLTGQASLQLSGPAPANGVLITLSATQPQFTFTLNEGMQTTVPSGQTTIQIPIGAIIETTPGRSVDNAVFTATLQNGNSLQAQAEINLPEG